MGLILRLKNRMLYFIDNQGGLFCSLQTGSSKRANLQFEKSDKKSNYQFIFCKLAVRKK